MKRLILFLLLLALALGLSACRFAVVETGTVYVAGATAAPAITKN